MVHHNHQQIFSIFMGSTDVDGWNVKKVEFSDSILEHQQWKNLALRCIIFQIVQTKQLKDLSLNLVKIWIIKQDILHQTEEYG